MDQIFLMRKLSKDANLRMLIFNLSNLKKNFLFLGLLCMIYIIMETFKIIQRLILIKEKDLATIYFNVEKENYIV